MQKSQLAELEARVSSERVAVDRADRGRSAPAKPAGKLFSIYLLSGPSKIMILFLLSKRNFANMLCVPYNTGQNMCQSF